MNDKSYQVSKVERNLQKLLGITDLSDHELIRLNTLSEMVSSILGTGRSELVQIARGQSPKTKLSSRIKKIKRWILNEKTSYENHYKPYALELLNRLSKQGELVFSIDGSVMGRGCMCLMFSVIYQGKALPIIWEVHKAKKGHLKEICHQSLLKELSLIVPKNCRVIIVGDGEFNGCNFQEDIKNRRSRALIARLLLFLISDNSILHNKVMSMILLNYLDLHQLSPTLRLLY